MIEPNDLVDRMPIAPQLVPPIQKELSLTIDSCHLPLLRG
jgi:hypothetical protein